MLMFAEWLQTKKNLKEGLADFMGGDDEFGRQPNNAATDSPLQLVVTLNNMANKGLVKDFNWIQLLEIFERYVNKMPYASSNMQFGNALLQAAKTGDMKGLQPYIAKHLKAQRII